jgi:hypothetical protein
LFRDYDNNDEHADILLTVPGTIRLEQLDIDIAAGIFKSTTAAVFSERTNIKVGAGECRLENLTTGDLDVECSMGYAEISGKQNSGSRTAVHVGMGSAVIRFDGDPDDFSFDTNVGLGAISVNGSKIAGIGSDKSRSRSSNHMDIHCTMGNVEIYIN